MAFLLLLWAKAAVYGLVFSQLVPGLETRVHVRLLTGLTATSVLSQYVNLFLPIHATVCLGMDVAVGGLFLYYRQALTEQIREVFRGLSWLTALGFGLVALVVLYLSSAPSTLHDMGLYYLQSLRWTQEYPAVPGLGNLFTRLANNSSWFNACALFNPAPLHPALALNGFLFFLTVTTFCHQFVRDLSGPAAWRAGFAVALAGAAVASLPLWQLEAPNTDVVAALLTWILLLRVLALENTKADSNSRFSLVLLAAFLPTIKLNTLPVLLVPAWWLMTDLRQKNYRQALALLGTLAFVFIPWLAKGVITSGYLCFPFYQLDLFHFDWKMPREILVLENELIKMWARIPYIDTSITARLSLGEWLPVWLLNQSPPNKLLLLSTTTGVVLYAKDLWRQQVRPQGPERLCLAVCALGIVLCLAGAPDLRFCYGFLLLFNVLLYAGWLQKFLAPAWVRRAVLPVLALVLLFHGGRAARSGDGSLLWPRHAYPGSRHIKFLNGIPVHLAQKPGEMGPPSPDDTPWIRWWKANHWGIYEDRLWMADLPASPYLRPGLRLRGNGLKDGFRIEKPGEPQTTRK